MMIIKTLPIDYNHWSTDCIPISYNLSQRKYSKSLTFLWSETFEVFAICRAYYISHSRIEIGDIWLNNKFRGKTDRNGVKYSLLFMKKIISKIWKIYPYANKISLLVSKDNITAIKLYNKLHFKQIKNMDNNILNIPNCVYMERIKNSKNIKDNIE